MRAMTIRDKYQAVMAPSPGPITVTFPVPSTEATVSSVEVNFAHRVTSRSRPSLNRALTVSVRVSPTRTERSPGSITKVRISASPALGPGAPSAIQRASVR